MDAFRARLQQIGARASSQDEVNALLQVGVDTWDELCAVLADRSVAPSLRSTAAWLIGRLGDPGSVEALMAVLDDNDPGVRNQAVVGLGGLAAVESVEPLLRMLDAAPQMREVVSWALGEIGDARAQSPLLAILADRSQPAALRGQAAESLASVGDPAEVVRSLLAALGDSEPEVRGYAAFALGAIGDPCALVELDRLAARDHVRIPDGPDHPFRLDPITRFGQTRSLISADPIALFGGPDH